MKILSNKDWALLYATKNWPVLPVHALDEDGQCTCHKYSCKEIAKHPILSESRYKEATKEHSKIHLLWAMYPFANVAIATGSLSGVIVLDVDKKNGGLESLWRIEKQYGMLPVTPRSHTGGGGLHIFFQAPRFELRGRIGMRPGIDVRAEDMNCIMPASKHKSGNKYEWTETWDYETPLAPLPAWLLGMIRTKNTPKKKVRYNIAW